MLGRVEDTAYVPLDSNSEEGPADAEELDLFQRASLLKPPVAIRMGNLGLNKRRDSYGRASSPVLRPKKLRGPRRG